MSDSAALTDDDFDDMHHALGRPGAEQHDGYRNFFCCEVSSDQARRFEEIGCWDFSRFINGGRDAVFHVNSVGKQKLHEWLRARAAPEGK